MLWTASPNTTNELFRPRGDVYFHSWFYIYDTPPCWRSGTDICLRVADLSAIPTVSLDLFSRPSHTSDLKIRTPVATLPGALHYCVCTETGWPGVNVL